MLDKKCRTLLKEMDKMKIHVMSLELLLSNPRVTNLGIAPEDISYLIDEGYLYPPKQTRLGTAEFETCPRPTPKAMLYLQNRYKDAFLQWAPLIISIIAILVSVWVATHTSTLPPPPPA